MTRQKVDPVGVLNGEILKILPTTISRVGVPPIKCQGIKTKLVRFILESIAWDGKGKWIEPFVGSGVVLFNLRPRRALAIDTNKHLIRFYQDIQRGKITPAIVRAFLESEGSQLRKHGAAHYYAVRDRFNKTGEPLDFLFLNRSCFNGVIRFNSKGGFNVPYGHKPERFAQAYITKIVNQVRWVEASMRGRDWQFEVGRWPDALAQATGDDFVYLDPPYIGRHVDYYNNWSAQDAHELASAAKRLPCGFALSMWKQNRYRQNTHLRDEWADYPLRTFAHFYHVSSTENLRNEDGRSPRYQTWVRSAARNHHSFGQGRRSRPAHHPCHEPTGTPARAPEETLQDETRRGVNAGSRDLVDARVISVG